MSVKVKNKVINLKLTQKHIDKAIKAKKRRNYDVCASCPIAQCARETFKSKKNVSAAFGEVVVGEKLFVFSNKKDNNKSYNLMQRFDGGELVKPTNLKIKLLHN